MKKILGLIVIVLFAAVNAFAVNGYYIEYKMTASVAGSSPTGSMKLYSTPAGDSRTEMNMSIGQMGGLDVVSLVKKSEPKKIYMLFESTKTYSVTDAATKDGFKDDATYEVSVLGTETVNGFKSTHVKIVRNKQPMEMWLSTDIANYAELSTLKGNEYYGNDKLLKALKAKGVSGFPVRIKAQQQGANIQFDLVKTAAQDIPSALLEIPAGYKEGDALSGMMKQMGLPSMDEIQKMTPEQRAALLKQFQQNGGK